MTIAKSSLLTICNNILQEVEEPVLSTVVSVTQGPGFQCLNHIDSILKEIYQTLGFGFEQTQTTSLATTAGTRSYALDDSIDENAITHIELLNHAVPALATQRSLLNFVDYSQWPKDRLYNPDSGVLAGVRGVPDSYTYFMRKLYLDPVPAAHSFSPIASANSAYVPISDAVAPTVSSVSPLTTSTGVARNVELRVVFAEDIDASTITTATFSLAEGVNPVSGSVLCSGNVATFIPAAALSASAAHTVTLSTGIKDLSGNALAAPYTWTFTTGTSLSEVDLGYSLLIQHVQRVANLSRADATTSLLPVEYEHVLIAGVTARMFISKDRNKFQIYEALYRQQKKEMAIDYLTANRQSLAV